jgi:hypothetical protein
MKTSIENSKNVDSNASEHVFGTRKIFLLPLRPQARWAAPDSVQGRNSAQNKNTK